MTSLLLPLAIFPERVPCLALNQPYASLLFGENGAPGRKHYESRLWEYPYEPGWLAIYATKAVDRGAIERLARDLVLEHPSDITAAGHLTEQYPLGAILGVVWIDGCRMMTAEDAAAACYPFDASEGRYVWPIRASYRFRETNTTHLARGPQKFVYVPAQVIADGLGTLPVPP